MTLHLRCSLQVEGARTVVSSSRRLLAVNSTENSMHNTSSGFSAPAHKAAAAGTPAPPMSGECDVPVSQNDQTVIVETIVTTRVDQVSSSCYLLV